MEQLKDKLDRILAREKDGDAGSDAADRASDVLAPPGGRERLKRASEVLLLASGQLSGFVEKEVARRYPSLFEFRELPYRAAVDGPVFGKLRTSAEHSVCQVVFRGRWCLWVRLSAVILSSELEVEAAHAQVGRENEAVRKLVDLAPHVLNDRVRWAAVYEALLVDFLGWYEARAAESAA
jgi:hypothetical protein